MLLLWYFGFFWCKKKILVSADFYFHRREEFCIPTLPIGNCDPLYWGKPVHSFFFFARKISVEQWVAWKSGTSFPLNRRILLSHKHTLRVLVLLFIMVENRNLFIYLSLQWNMLLNSWEHVEHVMISCACRTDKIQKIQNKALLIWLPSWVISFDPFIVDITDAQFLFKWQNFFVSPIPCLE